MNLGRHILTAPRATPEELRMVKAPSIYPMHLGAWGILGNTKRSGTDITVGLTGVSGTPFDDSNTFNSGEVYWRMKRPVGGMYWTGFSGSAGEDFWNMGIDGGYKDIQWEVTGIVFGTSDGDVSGALFAERSFGSLSLHGQHEETGKMSRVLAGASITWSKNYFFVVDHYDDGETALRLQIDF